MRRLFAFLFLLFIFVSSCAKVYIEPIRADTPFWKASKIQTLLYQLADSRKQRLATATAGVDYAVKCINKTPSDPACYYFHAINTGLYYQTKIVGYQKGLKTMISDCDTIIKLDPKYEHGGAYRILSQIYSEIPASAAHPDSVVRDIDKALRYANKAVEIDPIYPENQLVLAKVLLEADNKPDAAIPFLTARELLPNWIRHEDYPVWKKDIEKLEKPLSKYTKSLQLAQ